MSPEIVPNAQAGQSHIADLTPADVGAGAIAMMARDCARMRLAGGNLAEAAIRVIHDYDGLHRLSLAVAGWAEAIAAEGDRPHAQVDRSPEGQDRNGLGRNDESAVAKRCAQTQSHKGGNRNGGQ